MTHIDVDVVVVGAGIMGATVGVLLRELEPGWTVSILERLDGVALESTDAWNNAGTGHAALCEFNYTPRTDDGRVEIDKALVINEQFHVSRQFWSHLVDRGVLQAPESFITPVPHMSFAHGPDGVAYLRQRVRQLAQSPLFQGMRLSEDPAVAAEWLPLMFRGRSPDEQVAVSRHDAGTDVDYGSLTRQLMASLVDGGTDVALHQEVSDLVRTPDGRWAVTTTDRRTGRRTTRRAGFVFLAAGGGTLPLLQLSGVSEGKLYGGFPISGQFYCTDKPELVEQHRAKVYGAAKAGAPPISVPHLDLRTVGGRSYLLFGPYAAFSPKFLKHGRMTDLPRSITRSNLAVLLAVARDNRALITYLVKQVLQRDAVRFAALQEFVPGAERADWRLITAGQRVQVMRRTSGGGEIVGFGTEKVLAGDRSLAALLGSSPGASSAPSTVLEVLEACFADRRASWGETLRTMIPSYGRPLADDAELLRQVTTATAATLHLR